MAMVAKEKSRWSTILLGIGLVILPFLIKESVGVEKKPKLEHVIVARPGGYTMQRMVFEMGNAQGFYNHEGLSVEIMIMRGAIINSAMMGGGLDFEGTAGGTVRTAAVGVPVKLVFLGGTGRSTFIITRPEIKSFADLKGKRMGIGSIGSSEQAVTKILLKKFGLDPDSDVIYMGIGPELKIPALLAGSVEAVFGSLDDKMILTKKGYRVLIKASDYTTSLSQGIGVTDKKLKSQRDQVKRMVRGSLKALIFTRNNRNKVIDYMVKVWGWDREMSTESYDEDIKNFTKDGTVSDELIMAEIALAKMVGLKPKPDVKLQDMVDFSLVREAAKELGLNP